MPRNKCWCKHQLRKAVGMLLFVMLVFLWAMFASGSDNATTTCLGSKETFTGKLPDGSGTCTVSDFKADGFGPGVTGTVLLDCTVNGQWVHFRIPAACQDGKLYIAGFPCDRTDRGLKCLLTSIEGMNCYEVHGRTYCFKEPVAVMTLEEGGNSDDNATGESGNE